MARETNKVLGHGDESDGIEEYDNPLPDWWIGLFIITVVWGALYTVSYHLIQNNSQIARYEAEMTAAEMRWPRADGAVVFRMDPELVAEGEGIFAQSCAVCHMADMSGGIGPNLVDDTWIHGGSPDAIVHTITNGVPLKGMVAWGPVLGPQKVQAVAAYVESRQTIAVADRVTLTPAVVAAPVPDADAGTDLDDDTAKGAAIATGPGEVGAPSEPVPGDPMVDGLAVFTANCTACHGVDMTGGVGPNLVDDVWIHGSALDQIRGVIVNGVPEKGMIAWGPILQPAQIEMVAQYVQTVSTRGRPE